MVDAYLVSPRSYHSVLPKSSGPYEQRLQLYGAHKAWPAIADGRVEAWHSLNHELMFRGYKASALRLMTSVADWADAHAPRTSSAL